MISKMQLFVLDTIVGHAASGSDGPENIAPVGRVLKATSQPARQAGSYLQRSHREKFPVSLVPGTLMERIIGPGQ